MDKSRIAFWGISYKYLLKPVLFLMSADFVHDRFLMIGEFLGSNEISKSFMKRLFGYENKGLEQKLAGISFKNPIGLAAGFDYNANLTQILPSVGFGFMTVGTVTNMAYEGNPMPRLGRLPKSKSLLVNKGFKSEGAKSVIKRLKSKKFDVPLGISIGRTNSAKLKNLEESIEDIVSAFKKFEETDIQNSYYEMNISCPNIIHSSEKITFYTPKNLEKLLRALDKLKLKKPVFIKMPITESDADVIKMMNVIVKHEIAGVIFGNLEKDRKNKVFEKDEIKNASMGNFSGRPCWNRSNELISLVGKKYGEKIIIIGCGGVMSAEDAYEKIRRGASLVQMITGMVYEGPSVISKINLGLVELLERDGYKNISKAVGTRG